MAVPGKHLEKSRYNEDFANRCKSKLPNDTGWYLVVLFYSALHLVDGYLATKKWAPKLENHGERWIWIKKCPELYSRKPFRNAYRSLQDISEQVRYDPLFVVRNQNIADADNNLAKVKSFLTSKIERVISATQ